MKLEINENIIVSGELSIHEGEASNIVYDDMGIPASWDFNSTRDIRAGNNIICTTGLNFVFQRNWGIPFAVAIGNGLVDGSNAPAATDTSLNAELLNGRFGVRGDRYSRVSNNKVVLSALWTKGQSFIGTVTEWGLFCNEEGVPALGRNTGFLLARRAYEFNRVDATKDIQILWVISVSST